jgi:hypothetical protein
VTIHADHHKFLAQLMDQPNQCVDFKPPSNPIQGDTMPNDPYDPEVMFHKGMIKEMIEEECHKHYEELKKMTTDPNTLLAFMNTNKQNDFGLGGGGMGSFLLGALLTGNRNGGGLFGGNNGSDVAATAAISNPQFTSLQHQMDTLGNTLSVMQGGIADAQRADSAEHRVDTLQDAMTAQTASVLSEVNEISRSQAETARELATCCCETQKSILGVNTNLALMEARNQAALCSLEQRLSNQASVNEAAAVARHTQLIMADKDAENRQLRDQLFAASQTAQTATILAALGNKNNGDK